MSWEQTWQVDGRAAPSSGGQGEVLLVTHRITGERGALKILHAEQQGQTARRLRFWREVLALEEMRDVRGIPTVLEHNVHEHLNTKVELYLVQEWIQGRPFSQVVNGRPQTLDDALKWSGALLTLVSSLEGKIVHRDIKPDNVMLDDAGQVWLLDFGIAHLDASLLPEGGHADYKTSNAEELGNRFIRLPELTAGNKSEPSVITDLTFVVAMLYYMVTGHQPRLLEDPKGRKPHQRDEFTRLKNADPRWLTVQSIFEVGFSHRPAYRFQDAGMLRELLDNSSTPSPNDEFHGAEDDYERMLSQLEENEDQRLSREIYAIAVDLENYLRQEYLSKNLTPSFLDGGPHKDGLYSIFSSLNAISQSDQSLRIDVTHRIQPDESDSSRLRAFLDIQGEPTWSYHQGMVSDVTGFRNKVESRKQQIMRRVLTAIAARIRARQT